MRASTSSTAGALMLVLLSASLGIKGLAGAGATDAAAPADSAAASEFLKARGLTVGMAAAATAPAWVHGTRGECHVAIADVSPQGWFRDIVAEQATGQRLRYAYDGQFYDDQPVFRTKIDDYRRRFLRYFGLAAPARPVRAVIVSPACPEETVRTSDAAALSR